MGGDGSEDLYLPGALACGARAVDILLMRHRIVVDGLVYRVMVDGMADLIVIDGFIFIPA